MPDGQGPWTRGRRRRPRSDAAGARKPAVAPLDRAVQVTRRRPAIRRHRVRATTTSARRTAARRGRGRRDTTTPDRDDRPGRRPHQRHRLCLPGVRPERHRPQRRVAVSDAVTPCGSAFECTPILAPFAGGLGILLLVGSRPAHRRPAPVAPDAATCVAVVDVVHTANLGHGSKLGIGFVQAPRQAADRRRRRPTGRTPTSRSATSVAAASRSDRRQAQRDRGRGHHHRGLGRRPARGRAAGVQHQRGVAGDHAGLSPRVATRRAQRNGPATLMPVENITSAGRTGRPPH